MNASPESVSNRQEHKEFENIKQNIKRYKYIRFSWELEKTPFELYKYLTRVDVNAFCIVYKNTDFAHDNCRINNQKLIEQMEWFLSQKNGNDIIWEVEASNEKSGQMSIIITLWNTTDTESWNTTDTESLKTNKNISSFTTSINKKINRNLN